VKFIEPRPFADPVQDGRIYIERVNEPFLAADGNGEQFRAGIERAIALGCLWRHESAAPT
jgi:hypothetical protein